MTRNDIKQTIIQIKKRQPVLCTDVINEKGKPKNFGGNPADIINFYDVIPKKYIDETINNNEKLHGIKMPFRMCIAAPSGSGKTNFLLNLLKVFSHGKGTFADVYIITSDKDEPLYNYLDGEFDGIVIKEGMFNTPKLEDMDKKYNTLVIWDDLVLDKNKEVYRKYFMKARKKNCSVIFISQSYVDIDKFCRKNSNYLVLFDLGGSKLEEDRVLREWGCPLDKDELRAVYNDAISTDMNPLIIQGGKCKDMNKKFSKGFNNYYNLTTFLPGIERTKAKKVYVGDKLKPINYQKKITIEDSDSD